MVRDFKKLTVWEKAMALTKNVYLLSKELPTDERFGLAIQMRRCAVSIPSNIAEGSQRKTDKDYRQFLSISAGSAAELETQLLLAREIYHVTDRTTESLLEEVQKMLYVFIKKL